MATNPRTSARIIHRVGIERFATGLVRKISKVLDKAEADIEQKLIAWVATHDTEAGYGAETKRRLEKLLEEIRKINAVAHRVMYRGTRADLVALAKSEREFAHSLAASQFAIGVKFNVPTARLLEQAVDAKPFQGRLLKDWFNDLNAASAKRINDAVVMGLVQGESPDQIVKRVAGSKALAYKDGAFAVSRRMLEATVRTATASAHNEAHEAFAKENPDLYEGVRWITTLDSRACAVCAEKSGEIFPVGEGPRPPIHFNCLPGDALVTTQPITAASRRKYKGRLAVIKTSSGRIIEATPNHPILTRDGWIGAGRLQKSNYLICDTIVERVTTRDDVDIKNVPARIEDIFKALQFSNSSFTTETVITPEDFHGDGSNGKVTIIWPYSFLGGTSDPTILQHNDDFIFPGSDHAQILFSSQSPTEEFFFRSFISSLCSSSFPTLSLFFGRTHIHHTDRKGLGSATGNPQSPNVLKDNTWTDAEAISDLIHAGSSFIHFDEVIDISFREFHGYVYNIETPDSKYSVNGIISHNCRCTIEAIPLGSPVESEPTYENWLGEQDEETQRDTLGDARYQLWKSGVPVRSFVVDDKTLTLDELKQRDYAAWVRLWPEKV